jgi:hypothetical protein
MNLWHKIQEMLRLFFLAFHRARIALCWIGLESQSLTFVILSVHLILCLYSGDIATCDGVGGVEGPPSPPVVGIRVAPEVLGVPPGGFGGAPRCPGGFGGAPRCPGGSGIIGCINTGPPKRGRALLAFLDQYVRGKPNPT